MSAVATILLCGVDLFFRGKLDALLPGHHLITTDNVDPPDVVIVDIARIDPTEVADAWPDVPIIGFTNHNDTGGLGAPTLPGSTRCRRSPRSSSGSAGSSTSSSASLARVSPVTYIIAEPCIDIKDRSCVDVCPVDCIHEAERILVIDPEECIDCGACEPECPVEAIFPEDALPDKWEPFIKINYAYGEGFDVVNKLTNEYATEHNVQNPPLT